VTAATALMWDLRDRIEERGIDQTFRIYLCQKYAPGQPSNHAEMCLVGAVGAANLNNITFFECTSPSCDYCDTFLDHYNVPNTSPDGEPASQAGWVHPFARVAFGTQLGDHATQVQELAAYLDDTDTAELVVGRTITTAPRQGRFTHWLG